jgi:hypothetical protein
MFIRPSVYQPPQHTKTKDNEQWQHPHGASLVYKITHSCFIDIKLSMKHSQYQFGKPSKLELDDELPPSRFNAIAIKAPMNKIL